VRVHSDRLASAYRSQGEARLAFQMAAMQTPGFGPYNVASWDHSETPAANFTGPDTQYTLTVCVNRQVVFVILVPDRSDAHLEPLLKAIGEMPRPPGSVLINAVDNLPHSGTSPHVLRLELLARAIGSTQDLFHVVKLSSEGIDPKHPHFASGKVKKKCMLYFISVHKI